METLLINNQSELRQSPTELQQLQLYGNQY